MKTSSEDTAETAPIESIIDHESLRNRDDIPFHEETDLVDGETLERVGNLDDMAPVGVTNDEGEVLLMRVDEDCAWKIPSPSVGPSEDYAEVARRWVTDRPTSRSPLTQSKGCGVTRPGWGTKTAKLRAISLFSVHHP